MAEKLLSKELTLIVPWPAAVVGDELPDVDDEPPVVGDVEFLDEELHAVPRRPSVARSVTPPTRVDLRLITPILLMLAAPLLDVAPLPSGVERR
jgi:hypothetical protein